MQSHLRLCLVDMNHGHPNQAMRCFRVLIDGFFAKVKAANPGLETTSITVQPRNLLELPPTDCDLYLSSGGPGSPFEHDGEAWLTSYYGWLDSIVERNLREGSAAPGLLGVCYTFELLINHFKVARMVQRANRKFGVMPIYTTAEGLAHPLTAPFQDRLFAFENRSWEAVDLDERQLRSLGGKLLARESRDGYSKGLGLHAFEFAPGIEGTQFHPEADKPGVIAWLRKREQAEAFIEAYGAITYQRMLRTLDNPERLAKTFTSLIPGWLTRRFNALAQHRGWAPLPRPELSFELFAGDAPSAASIAYHSLLPSDLPRPPQLDFDDAAAPVNFTGAEHFDSAPPISEVLVPLARPTELDPAALGESVLQPPWTIPPRAWFPASMRLRPFFLLALSLSACFSEPTGSGADPNGTTLTLSITDIDGLGPLSTWAEINVFVGTCPDEVALADGVFGPTFRSESYPVGAPPPSLVLPANDYGLAVLYRDSTCGITGFGCVNIDPPRTQSATIRVNPTYLDENGTLLPEGACVSPQVCTRGRCQQGGGGSGQGGSSG